MAITQIDRSTCRLLTADIEAALATVAAKHGISIHCKGGSFSPTSYTAKVECAVVAANGVAETMEVTDFRTNAGLFGLKATDLGRTFRHAGSTYEICGLKRWATKAPILGKRPDGKTFKFPVDVVVNALGAGQ